MKKLLAAFFIIAGIFLLQANGVMAQDDPLLIKLNGLCDEGNDSACFRLGERYRTLDRDNKTAEKYYLKACDTGHLDGCTFAGILTAKKGRSHFKKAAELFKKGCDKDQTFACYNLANLKYKEGRQSKAKKLYKKACDLGHRQGCSNFKRLNK